MHRLHFEDMPVGFADESRELELTREEVVEFAERWDPQPFHVDEQAARASMFGGLTACAAHIFAIQCKLASGIEPHMALLAGLGSEGFELRNPARPGDRLRVQRQVVGARASRTRPDRGVVRVEHTLLNQDDAVVFHTVGRIMIARRGSAAEPG